MRNFFMGLLLGTLATYCYLTQMDSVRGMFADWWVRASSPPVGRKF